MKPSTHFFTFTSFYLCLDSGLIQAQVHLPFAREVRDLSSTLFGRGTNPSISTWGNDYVFVVNASVGTPGQNVALVISPSAADTWVPDATSSYCIRTESGYDTDDNGDYVYNTTYLPTYCLWGSFDKSASSTYQRANSAYRSWEVYYPDSTFVEGYNFTDTLNIGDITLDNLPMGLADSSQQGIGMLGLGSNYSYSGGTYDNLPDRLVKSGQIVTKAYSIWLDAEDGTSGSLLLGAVDTSRFDGNLTRLDGSAYSSSTFYGSFGVTVTAINGSNSGSAALQAFTTNELPFGASISPGETFSNLPDILARKIWSMAGATYNSSIALATIPCDSATKATDGGARFTFELTGPGGPVLDVRLADLILPQTVAALMWGSEAMAPPNTCLFAVQNGSTWGYTSDDDSSYEYYSVGSALLRRAYMVFDLVNQEVSLAPVKFDTTAVPSIVAFQGYGAPAPSATIYCNGYSSSCGAYGSSTPRPGSSGSGDSGSSNSGVGLDIPLVAGLSVAFGLLSLVALIGAFAVWRKLATRKKLTKEIGSDGEEGGEDVVAAGPVPVMQGERGSAADKILRVREMTDTSRNPPLQVSSPQVGSLSAEHGRDPGMTHWPLQADSQVPGAQPRDVPLAYAAENASSGSRENKSMGGSLPLTDTNRGKGKDIALDEEH